MNRRDVIKNLGLVIAGFVVGIGSKIGLKMKNPNFIEIHDVDKLSLYDVKSKEQTPIYLVKRYLYPVGYQNGRRRIDWRHARCSYLNRDMKWETHAAFEVLPERLYHRELVNVR